jgi:hypothetical protein
VLVNNENQCPVSVNVKTEQESLLFEEFTTLLREEKLEEPVL